MGNHRRYDVRIMHLLPCHGAVSNKTKKNMFVSTKTVACSAGIVAIKILAAKTAILWPSGQTHGRELEAFLARGSITRGLAAEELREVQNLTLPLFRQRL